MYVTFLTSHSSIAKVQWAFEILERYLSWSIFSVLAPVTYLESLPAQQLLPITIHNILPPL